MEDECLENRIETRKKQAANRKLVDRCYTIVRSLGEEEARRTISDCFAAGEVWGNRLVFNYKELRIVSCGDTGSEVYVVEGDEEKLVFYGYKDEMWYKDPKEAKDVIKAYIPGRWERHLLDLYRKATAAEKRRKVEETLRTKGEEREELCRTWGI